MAHNNISRRVAVLSCEPNDQGLFSCKGKKRTVREITSLKLKELGLEPIIYRPLNDISDFPSSGQYGAVVVGGSKLDIFDKDLKRYGWMHKLLDFIREAHEKVPIIGLCFGHQAIGRAFGAQLKRFGIDVGYEVGFAPVMLTPEAQHDQLFRGLPDQFDALFSHFCYIATLPEGGTLLAVSDNPSLQAFRVGETTWGLQHHPEFSVEVIRELIHQRRPLIRHLVNVDAVLRTLECNERHDDIPLKRFAEFVSRN